jgi:hypothetical protein
LDLRRRLSQVLASQPSCRFVESAKVLYGNFNAKRAAAYSRTLQARPNNAGEFVAVMKPGGNGGLSPNGHFTVSLADSRDRVDWCISPAILSNSQLLPRFCDRAARRHRPAGLLKRALPV